MEVDKDDFYTYLNSLIGVAVRDDTFFFDEIGMDGLDAWTFIDTIEKKYCVDFSGYNWQEYHVSDADIANFLKNLLNIFKKKFPTKKFSALHLYNVVQIGKWFEP